MKINFFFPPEPSKKVPNKIIFIRRATGSKVKLSWQPAFPYYVNALRFTITQLHASSKNPYNSIFVNLKNNINRLYIKYNNPNEI